MIFRLKNNTIKKKLFFNAIILFFIPLMIMSTVSFFLAKGALKRNIKEEQLQISTEINQTINYYLESFEKYVLIMADDGDLIKANDDTYNSLINYLNNNEDISDVHYYDLKTDKVFHREKKTESPNDFFKTNVLGNILMNKDTPLMTGVHFSEDSEGNVITFAKGVLGKDNNVVGVIYLDVSINNITKMLQEVSNEYSLVTLLSKDYEYLCSSAEIMTAEEGEDFIEYSKSYDGYYEYKNKNNKKINIVNTIITNEYTGWKLIVSFDREYKFAEITHLKFTNSVSTFIFMIVVLVIFSIVSGKMTRNINTLVKSFELASNGNLKEEVILNANDEFDLLAKYFNEMIFSIKNLVLTNKKSSNIIASSTTTLKESSNDTTKSMSEIASAMENITNATSKLAESSQNGSSDMQDLSKEINKIDEDMDIFSKIVTDTENLNKSGFLIMNNLVEKSTLLNSSNSEVFNNFLSVKESIEEIKAISETITNISKQTNLLSLNAQIESARAGEAGKGFAVVANEVKKLSEQSAKSTDAIKTIINNILFKTEQTMGSMDNLNKTFDEQDLALGDTVKIFENLTDSIEDLMKKEIEVKELISSMRDKKDLVLQQIEDISAYTEENTAVIEEVTASIEEITTSMQNIDSQIVEIQELSEEFNQHINKFDI